jgi:hypothetical protein
MREVRVTVLVQLVRVSEKSVQSVFKLLSHCRNQPITRREPQPCLSSELISPKASHPIIVGRTVEQKKRFYKAVADGLEKRLGLRREDAFISLVEVTKENWSFGNGEAQYATAST